MQGPASRPPGLNRVLTGSRPASRQALIISVLLAFAPSAEASYNGCRFDPDIIDPIDYRFQGVTSDIQTAFRDGEAVWDSTSAPGYFSHDGSASDPNIDVHDAYYADVEWAGLWCLSSSSYEHLDSDSYAGAGEWTLPDSDTYLSSALPEGWFRVRTRHTVTWTGGSDAGYSKSVWIHIN